MMSGADARQLSSSRGIRRATTPPTWSHLTDYDLIGLLILANPERSPNSPYAGSLAGTLSRTPESNLDCQSG
jgi:hypothetical protein